MPSKRGNPPIQRADDPAYRQLWRLVDGEIRSCFKAHPDYLADPKRERTVRNSLTKRIVGKIQGYEAEKSRGVGLGSVERPKVDP